jgi:hypothetical protein
MYRFRYLYFSATAVLVAMAVTVPAQAGQPLRRGPSDFGLAKTQRAVPTILSRWADARVVRRGVADFGLPHGYTGSSTSSEPQPRPLAPGVRPGFDWQDAGVGASFAAGIAVLLGAVVVLASHRRSRLKGA